MIHRFNVPSLYSAQPFKFDTMIRGYVLVIERNGEYQLFHNKEPILLPSYYTTSKTLLSDFVSSVKTTLSYVYLNWADVKKAYQQNMSKSVRVYKVSMHPMNNYCLEGYIKGIKILAANKMYIYNVKLLPLTISKSE